MDPSFVSHRPVPLNPIFPNNLDTRYCDIQFLPQFYVVGFSFFSSKRCIPEWFDLFLMPPDVLNMFNTSDHQAKQFSVLQALQTNTPLISYQCHHQGYLIAWPVRDGPVIFAVHIHDTNMNSSFDSGYPMTFSVEPHLWKSLTILI